MDPTKAVVWDPRPFGPQISFTVRLQHTGWQVAWKAEKIQLQESGIAPMFCSLFRPPRVIALLQHNAGTFKNSKQHLPSLLVAPSAWLYKEQI